jgi:predicted SnoaL-like aldol condensation-catalyzing enzyme
MEDTMNDREALDYLRGYFDELFVKHNVDALDRYLDKEYFDHDIGDTTVDHIQNSKQYLLSLFEREPGIGVEVVRVMGQGDVISAFLEWTVVKDGVRQVNMKGVANFLLRGERILKRHTFIYWRG